MTSSWSVDRFFTKRPHQPLFLINVAWYTAANWHDPIYTNWQFYFPEILIWMIHCFFVVVVWYYWYIAANLLLFENNLLINFAYIISCNFYTYHDDVIKWKHFPRNWPFVRGIHRSPVNSPHKGQWRGAFMFSLISAELNGWVSNDEAGKLRRHRGHYDVIVMWC